MSTSKKTRSTKPVTLPAWEDVSEEIMGDSSRLVSRQPRNRRPVYAMPGMICMPSGGAGQYAVIEVMTKEIVIVRYESGRPEAYFWAEVELAAVQPHPRYVSGKR